MSKKGEKFRASISIDGKRKHLGYFTRARDAAMAYDEAIVKYHQPRTKFNFPEGMPIEVQSDDDDGYIHVLATRCKRTCFKTSLSQASSPSTNKIKITTTTKVQ